MLRLAAERYSDLEAVVDGDVRLTFAQLGEAVEVSTRAAMAAGLEPGDRVAIWAPNIHEWIVAALGLLGAGGVLVPLNTRFKGHEAAYILGKSRARILLLRQRLPRHRLRRACCDASRADLPELEHIVVLRGDAPDRRGRLVRLSGRRRRRSRPTTHATRIDAVHGDDLSDIIFTSGTTGRPKGAMSTHGQTLRVFDDWAEIVGLREGDRYLIVNPFFHTFGYKAGMDGRRS